MEVITNTGKMEAVRSKRIERLKAINEYCKLCEALKKGSWLQCDDCDDWVHGSCAGYTNQQVDAYPDNEKFYCQPCLDKRQQGQQEIQHPTTPPRDEDGQDNEQENIPSDETEPQPGPSNLNSSTPLATQTEENAMETEDSTTTDGDTDDEGYGTVNAILDWKATGRNQRQFLVEWKKGHEKTWVSEEDLDGAVAMLRAFCLAKKISPPRVEEKEGNGATPYVAYNKENWVKLDEIVRTANSYGKPGGIKVTKFSELGNEDSLSILQLGAHAFTILWLSGPATAIVADGKNSYAECKKTKQLIKSLLPQARNIAAPTFFGQRGEDHCGSSAALIAIELQRIYNREYGDLKTIPEEIKAPSSLADRIRGVFHKEPSKSISTRRTIGQQSFGVVCPNCSAKVKGKSRAALNFHKCQG